MGDKELTTKDILDTLWFFSVIVIGSLEEKTQKKIDQSLFVWSRMMRDKSMVEDGGQDHSGVAFLLLGLRYVCFLSGKSPEEYLREIDG